jgi:hypothetical protein
VAAATARANALAGDKAALEARLRAAGAEARAAEERFKAAEAALEAARAAHERSAADKLAAKGNFAYAAGKLAAYEEAVASLMQLEAQVGASPS